MTDRSPALRGLALAILLGSASCGGGGGDGGSHTLLAGSVLSPDGQVIVLQGPGTPECALAPLAPGEAWTLQGLDIVPDGTPVDLVRLDGAGNTLETLASTQTAAGRFQFDLSALGEGLASDLAVAAGSGAQRMRSSAVAESIVVDPLSEALLQLVLQQGVALEPFTLKELRDLDAAARLLALAEGVAATLDVPSTVVLLLQMMQASDALTDFLDAATSAGSTSAGPGDIGNFFPLAPEDTWRFAGTYTSSTGAHQVFSHSERVVERDSVGLSTVEVLDALGSSAGFQEFLHETSTALVNLGNDDGADPLSPAVVPFDEARFPLMPGERFTQFAASAIALGLDLDGDGENDKANVHSTVETIDFEHVSAIAGDFANALRIDRRIETQLLLSSGIPASTSLHEREWFAPHRGSVRSQATLTTKVGGQSLVELFDEELAAFQADGAGHGILPHKTAVLDCHPGNSDTQSPGRPGVAFDGTHFLVVTRRSLGGLEQLVGVRLSATGAVLAEFPILDQGFVLSLAEPAVSFDGTQFLVVAQVNGQIVGVRVATDGTVLDPGGFPISQSGSSNFLHAVAFDGTRHLVVWRKFDATLSGDIYGSFVTTAGSAVGEFAIHSAAEDQLLPEIVFGDGEYLVVWEDHASGTPQIRGARVTPAGAVLDPGGFEVTSGPGGKFSPAIAFDGSRYFAVWQEIAAFGTPIRGVRLEPDGSPTDPFPLSITTAPLANSDPTVAFDGTVFLAAWSIRGFSAPSGGIHVARINVAGQLLDGPASGSGASVAEPPSFTQLVHPTIALGAGRCLIAWTFNVELGGESKDVDCALIYPY